MELEKLKQQLVIKKQGWFEVQNKIDALIAKEHQPALEKKYKGKYFKHKNCYSGSKKWWVYAKVDSVEYPNSFKGQTFQTCTEGKVDFETKHNGYLSCIGKEITKSEYMAALKVAKNLIAKTIK